MIGAGGKLTIAPKRNYIFPIVDDNPNVTHSPDPTSKSFPFASQVHQPIPSHIQTVFSMTQLGKIYHFSAFLWFIVHRNNGAFYTVILSYLSSHYLIYLPK